MYLKGITTHGFKSFADKINIEFSKGTNGIVGPNGSGKSNIVDAVRWVLGEQSVKSLRGDGSMTDVIFSGSKSRNEAGSAFVTLTFDNTDKYLPLDYTEIALKRKVYKDGTNEYFLNNEKCRLKDITDILLDSGIAKESFNIISQGKIEEIISNKPSERRIVFEEAAGVLKYKRRKEEALRKLEKTHENIVRADDIINELEHQVEPLKEQRDKSLKYKELSEELQETEIALITNDITTMNEKYLLNKEQIEQINNKIFSLSTNNTSGEAKISDYKLKIAKIEEKIQKQQAKLIELTTKVEKINSQKQIILERKNYEINDTKLHNNLVELKENEFKITNEIFTTNNELDAQNKNLEVIKNEIDLLLITLTKIKEQKQQVENQLTNLLKINNNLNIKATSLKNAIETNLTIPTSVKSILENIKLLGIHNILGKIIEVEEQYTTAISTSLGMNANNVIVDNEQSAKEAIRFLKDNNKGRVTFFPLNIIKPKGIDLDSLNTLKNTIGFIDIASNLIKYDKLYHNIIANQLGNVIVAKDLDSANNISKKINYRYKIVTLNGELLHVGGSITGGCNNLTNILNSKYELESILKQIDNNVTLIKNIENQINEIDYNFKSVEDKMYLLNKDKISINEYNNSKSNFLIDLNNKLEQIKLNIKGTTSLLNNSLSKEENDIIKEYYEAIKEKEIVSNELNVLIKNKTDLNEELETYEYSVKKDNTLYNQKNKELKALEIEVNRLDVKLDILLNNLNTVYGITYEKAKNEYPLFLEATSAQTKVNNLKNEIKELGTVNLGAKEEYDRVSTRYEFLINQKEDLINAENILLNIIQEMDSVMEKEFLQTFNIIKEKFNDTFKELFKGGYADLKLSDPKNILETGIEIIASPPGKKLTTISLLSGGEKTFTAISLLFAILKSRNVPFCIFDEVEAALDEANVNSFGEYLNKLKDKTQFILITHKKKTMEFVDVLYGITMQESGVSKLVSVKLEDLRKE